MPQQTNNNPPQASKFAIKQNNDNTESTFLDLESHNTNMIPDRDIGPSGTCKIQ